MAGNDFGDMVRIYGFSDYRLRMRDVQGVVASRDDHDRDAPRRWTRLKFPEDSPPVHLREQEVENDNVRQIFVNQPQGREAIAGAHHRKAVYLQRHAVHLGQRRVIFDHQNPWT